MIDAVKILKDLVRMNTVNPPGKEEVLIRYLEKIFVQEEIEYTYQETAPERGNIIAWLPATEATEEASLILLSHIDVVGAKEEQWDLPPFGAEEKNGYIYGRGTVDTKQLTVMELAAFLELKRREGQRKRNVYFIATSDEESGSIYGLKWLLSHDIIINGKSMTGAELFKDSDVISEGGGFPIVAGKKEFYLCESGQKTCGTVEFTVKARNANGVFLQSADGMERAMSLVMDIGSYEMEGKTLKTVDKFEKKLAGEKMSAVMQKILEAMKHNTMTVTMVTGKNINEIAVTCDIRLIPGYGMDYLEKILNKMSQKWDCVYKIISLGKGYECNPEGEFLSILEDATLQILEKRKEEAEILPFVSMGSSDGHLLTDTGARVFGYSPVYSWDMTFDSAVTMVHGINERIHRKSIIFGCNVLTLAVDMAVGGTDKSKRNRSIESDYD